MLFNSWQFAIYFIVVTAAYFALPYYHQARTRLAQAYGQRPPLASRLISRWDLTKLMSPAP